MTTRPDRPISTPLSHRLRRFRENVVPFLTFGVCAVLVTLLWQHRTRQGSIVGEVEAVRIDVTAAGDGRLVSFGNGRAWTLFDRVESGELLARLDDTPILAELVALQAELAGLHQQVDAEAARLEMDQRQLAVGQSRLKMDRARLAMAKSQDAMDETQMAMDRARLAADQERLAMDAAASRENWQQEKTRLLWQVERCRIDVIERRTAVEMGRIELKRLEAELKASEQFFAKTTATNPAGQSGPFLKDEAAEALKGNIAALSEAEDAFRRATAQLTAHTAAGAPIAGTPKGELPGGELPGGGLTEDLAEVELPDDALVDGPPIDVEAILAPLRQAITVGQARIDALQLQIDSLEIIAPISGTVCTVHCYPGENIRAGDPVVTLASEHGRYVVSYAREVDRSRPQEGMSVAIRIRRPGARPVDTVVQRVGPQVELIPPRQCRDPNVPEYGQPIRIALPNTLDLRPGELVDVAFRSREPSS